ncbi:MAG: hydroxymethylpyrimidine/phosphomethylpyrimidine kinase [Opitutae bacterium]|nr:hydroxymethylpyrimidine/phosphomethylpyrimidine kinase [Opitutae bacterium]
MPTVLIVAGSDSSCGAGLSADLEVVRTMGCRPLLAVTAVTAQTDQKFLSSQPVDSSVFKDQLEAAWDHSGGHVSAVKIGMLPNESIVEILIEFLQQKNCPNVVLDPLLKSTSGGHLADESSVSKRSRSLFPLATLVTPNIPEACSLTGLCCLSTHDLHALANAIIGLGPAAVLVKGGHLEGSECMDYLLEKGVSKGQEFRQVRLSMPSIRGTGCRLASGIAARLALGDDLEDAVENARSYLFTYFEKRCSS